MRKAALRKVLFWLVWSVVSTLTLPVPQLLTVLRNTSLPALLVRGDNYHEIQFGNASSTLVRNSILLVPNLISAEEVHLLIHQADHTQPELDGAAANTVWGIGYPNTSRVRVCDMAPKVQDLVATIIEDRLLPFLVAQLPFVIGELFSTMPKDWEHQSLAALQFTFSTTEPAVNIYHEGGHFYRHTDEKDLTLNLHLDPDTAFTGGGTFFWAEGRESKPSSQSQILLQPAQGTSVVFNGRIRHAGRAVTSGVRHLLVASFSLSAPSTPLLGGVHAALLEQRLHQEHDDDSEQEEL